MTNTVFQKPGYSFTKVLMQNFKVMLLFILVL